MWLRDYVINRASLPHPFAFLPLECCVFTTASGWDNTCAFENVEIKLRSRLQHGTFRGNHFHVLSGVNCDPVILSPACPSLRGKILSLTSRYSTITTRNNPLDETESLPLLKIQLRSGKVENLTALQTPPVFSIECDFSTRTRGRLKSTSMRRFRRMRYYRTHGGTMEFLSRT